MKNTTIISIANYLKNVPEMATEYKEIAQEAAKIEAKASAAKSAYDAARDVVMAILTDVPVTVADLFTKCENDLPEGFTKSKLQYALINYWTDEVVKIQNGKSPNQYRKA